MERQRALEDYIELNAELWVLREYGLACEGQNCQEEALWVRQGELTAICSLRWKFGTKSLFVSDRFLLVY